MSEQYDEFTGEAYEEDGPQQGQDQEQPIPLPKPAPFRLFRVTMQAGVAAIEGSVAEVGPAGELTIAREKDGELYAVVVCAPGSWSGMQVALPSDEDIDQLRERQGLPAFIRPAVTAPDAPIPEPRIDLNRLKAITLA